MQGKTETIGLSASKEPGGFKEYHNMTEGGEEEGGGRRR